MKISILASGSRGNCTLIHDDNTAILLDMGISTRQLKKSLATLHLNIDDLSAVFITHEHIDHIKGLKTFTKNYHIPIYSKTNTLKQIAINQQLNEDSIRNLQILPENNLMIGNLTIKHFTISHDAIDPVGYSIYKNQKSTIKNKITLATDLGFVSNSVKEELEASHTLILEANHDLNLLQNGQYPWSLKKRILGTRGHLSNNDAGYTVSNLKIKPQQVILAHLSEQNNTPDIALNTVKKIFDEQNLSDIPLHVASSTKILNI